jgi:hypothetical protein
MPAQTLVIAAPIVRSCARARHNTGDRCSSPATRSPRRRRCARARDRAGDARVSLEPPGPLLAAAAIGIFLLVGAKSLSPRLISMRDRSR